MRWPYDVERDITPFAKPGRFLRRALRRHTVCGASPHFGRAMLDSRLKKRACSVCCRHVECIYIYIYMYLFCVGWAAHVRVCACNARCKMPTVLPYEEDRRARNVYSSCNVHARTSLRQLIQRQRKLSQLWQRVACGMPKRENGEECRFLCARKLGVLGYRGRVIYEQQQRAGQHLSLTENGYGETGEENGEEDHSACVSEEAGGIGV